MISETLLVNRSGQDIEYRLAGGGMAAVEWAPLPGGATLSIGLPEPPYAVELRLGEQTATATLEKAVASIEVTSRLQIDSRPQTRPLGASPLPGRTRRAGAEPGRPARRQGQAARGRKRAAR
ncbi:MAG TPA: hypothetical protein VEG34_13120 [Thermoanaerobaculia bacterium]|nr:hypothetical protein [Thermoanaerobaculia bacterium]